MRGLARAPNAAAHAADAAAEWTAAHHPPPMPPPIISPMDMPTFIMPVSVAVGLLLLIAQRGEQRPDRRLLRAHDLEMVDQYDSPSS